MSGLLIATADMPAGVVPFDRAWGAMAGSMPLKRWHCCATPINRDKEAASLEPSQLYQMT